MKFSIFAFEKNICILHRQVFVMKNTVIWELYPVQVYVFGFYIIWSIIQWLKSTLVDDEEVVEEHEDKK